MVMTYEDVLHQKHVAYAKDTASEVSDFFANSDSAKCPITKCSLLNKGCTDANPETSLKMDSTEFQITSASNKATGYNQ